MTTKASLRVAVVGAGPAGMYAVGNLLERRDLAVEIDLYERLPTPWGLVRAGVAPDHPQKKWVIDRLFAFYLNDPRVRFLGNLDIGVDIAVDDMRRWYHAVIFTVGAGSDTKLNIPGEWLEGVSSARDFVSYYNGHPDFAAHRFDLLHRHAVVVGTGNVALDVARILTLPPDELARTEIADNALAALRTSAIEQVTILGRRGPEYAAYNAPELEELGDTDRVNIEVTGVDWLAREGTDGHPLTWVAQRKMDILRGLTERTPRSDRKRIVFRFFAAPVALNGDGRVESLEVVRTGTDGRPVSRLSNGLCTVDTIETGLVLRACGYQGVPLPGLPFDASRKVIANRDGRVISEHGVISGVYVAGWIKRGCRGVIGSNKLCAAETVARLLEDFAEGRLAADVPEGDAVFKQLSKSTKPPVTFAGWSRIDHVERLAGRHAHRPRVKITGYADLLAAASAASDDPLKGSRLHEPA